VEESKDFGGEVGRVGGGREEVGDGRAGGDEEEKEEEEDGEGKEDEEELARTFGRGHRVGVQVTEIGSCY